MRRVLWAVLAVTVLLIPPSPAGGEREAAESRRPDDPDPGRTLRIGVTRLPTLDPAHARSVDQVLVSDQLFDSLTALDPETHQPVPSLAQQWQASPDQRQWDFVLRPGAAFSNGRPITATDVKYTIERVTQPGSGSPAGDLLRPVSGFEAFNKGGAPQLAGVSAPAPNVVHFSLDQPWSVLPSVLSSPLFGVVARESVEAAAPAPSFDEQPVTSGPFRFHRQRGEILSLVPAGEGKARVTGIDVIRYDEVTDAYRAFKEDRLDFTRVPADEVNDAGRRYGRDGFQPYLAELFYAFNMKSPKFADPRFREAIVRGIDRRALVSAIYRGTVRPIDSTVIAGVHGYQEDACGRCQHDPQRARALVAEAFKEKPPPPVGLDYDDDATQEALARAVQASLQRVGIPVVLRPKPPRDYDTFALSDEPELFRLGWLASYPSADAILPPLFQSQSPNNLTGFASPAVDAQLQAARAENDPGRRVELFQQADSMVMDQLPVVPIAQFNLHSVMSDRTKGIKLDSLGSFDAAAVRIG